MPNLQPSGLLVIGYAGDHVFIASRNAMREACATLIFSLYKLQVRPAVYHAPLAMNDAAVSALRDRTSP
jgi:hypothetical protein